MMCPLSVLVLGNFCGEKSAWPRHRLTIFYFGFRVGVTLQAPESFLTMAENQRVRHPDPIGIRFDSSGWISRVIMEVGPHLDLATFTSFYGSYDRDYCLAVWVCVCVLYSIWKYNSCLYLQIVQSNKNMLK